MLSVFFAREITNISKQNLFEKIVQPVELWQHY